MNIRGAIPSFRLQYNIVRFNLHMTFSRSWRRLVDLTLGPVETHYLTEDQVTATADTIWGQFDLTRSIRIVGRARSPMPRQRTLGFIIANPPDEIRYILPRNNWFPGDTAIRVRDQLHLQKKAYDNLKRSFQELEEWSKCSREQRLRCKQ